MQTEHETPTTGLGQSGQPSVGAFQSSDELNELFAALAKAQGEMEGAKKDSANPFFKSAYADLASCWECCRDSLSKNGLCVIQIPLAETPELVVIKSVLGHSSGQWVSNTVCLRPVKADPQGVGSAMTYARRYGLMPLVGIAPEEDDGNAASGRHNGNQNNTQPRQPDQYRGAQNPNAKVSDAQLKRLFAISKKHNWEHVHVKDQLERQFGLESTKDLNRKQYDELIEVIENGHPTVEAAKQVFEGGQG